MAKSVEQVSASEFGVRAIASALVMCNLIDRFGLTSDAELLRSLMPLLSSFKLDQETQTCPDLKELMLLSQNDPRYGKAVYATFEI